MAGGSWYAMLSVAAFLSAVWFAGRFSQKIGISSIVMEVAVGLILGPQVLNLMPEELTVSFYDNTWECDLNKGKYQQKVTNEGKHYCDLEAYVAASKYDDYWGPVSSSEYTIYLDAHGRKGRRLATKSKEGKTDSDTYSKCILDSCELKQALATSEVPDVFTLAGHIGVGMMIFESGMHFDFSQAKTVGPWACAVAILGTFLPIISGTALAFSFGFDMTSCLCAGVSLAPTSVGIALKLLHEADALSEYFGQAVMTAAFVDDVLSLILFSVLFTVGGGGASFIDFLPLILGCLFMAITIPAAVLFWPPFLKWLFSKIPETKPDAKLTRHHEVMFLILLATLLAYGQVTFMCGTHLWGCFIAGMSFATQDDAHHIWVRQVKRNTSWFLRIFFACTLAWSIPVTSLFSLPAFWKGTLMGLGPCIACKVLCGPFMGSSRWVIGWAMVGRAEFAYFIAILAKSMKMMHEDLFAILIWALLYATVFAPLIFRKVLARYMHQLGNDEAAEKVEHCALPDPTSHLPDFHADDDRNELRNSKRRSVTFKIQLDQKIQELEQVNQDIVRQTNNCSEKEFEISSLKSIIKNLEEQLEVSTDASTSKPTSLKMFVNDATEQAHVAVSKDYDTFAI